MNKKDLVLLCDQYPNTNGEFFLDDEIDILSGYFGTIHILCTSPKQGNGRKTPSNVVLHEYQKVSLISKIGYLIQGLFYYPLWESFFHVKQRYGIWPNLKIFKILWADYIKSSHVIDTLQHLKLIHPSQNILYSYWHDYKALAIARISKNIGSKSVARAHGWDIDYLRHPIPYLPFKFYILHNITHTFCISKFGKLQFEKILQTVPQSLSISKLGKNNHRNPNLKINDQNKRTLCSCSSLIPLKRIDKIIDLISKIKSPHVTWVHFGDGPLHAEILSYAQSKLSHIQFELKGNVSNAEILDFYNKNYVDLFINLSESEGIPVSIMEAQSAGIPVLATAVGGTPEIVNDENGFLIAKDFDMMQCVQMISDYLDAPNALQEVKRSASYANWQENYNAEKNYHTFANELLALR